MTAVSPDSVTTVSKSAFRSASAAVRVSVPVIGECSVGAAVMRKKFSQPGVPSKPDQPSWPMGSSAFPSKQK